MGIVIQHNHNPDPGGVCEPGKNNSRLDTRKRNAVSESSGKAVQRTSDLPMKCKTQA